MNIAELLPELLKGFIHFTWGNAVMITAALILIYLAVYKEIEPVLLLPIGFGCLLANIPLAGMTAGQGQGNSLLRPRGYGRPPPAQPRRVAEPGFPWKR